MRRDSLYFRSGKLRTGRIFITVFIIEIAIYLVVSSIEFNDPQLLSQFESQQSSIDSLSIAGMFISIFPHNLFAATLEVIPFIGQVFFLISNVETAMIISLEGGSLHVNGLFIFLSLAIFPHTWLELPSYAIATTSSIALIYGLLKRGYNRKEAGIQFILFYLLLALELGVAGLFESIEIYMERTYPSPQNVTYPLLLWIPAIPLLYLLFRLFRMVDRFSQDGGDNKGIPDDPPDDDFL
ncbi:MAG TPA: stage II sporulation protein M [Thermoplasmataceae archaeon]|nr:stage II sporulation protein M [Thermoplasmataceae archaeon]